MKIALMVSAAVGFGLIIYSELFVYHRMPMSSRFLKLASIWALLGFVADFGAPQIALAFAVGLLLTMFFTYYRNGQPFLASTEPTTDTTGRQRRET